MARRVRLTVFSRFLLVMLIVVPVAYFTASYINDQNGIEEIKTYFDNNSTTETANDNKRSQTERKQPQDPQAQIRALQIKIKALEGENKQLKTEVTRLKTEIANLKSGR